MDKSLKRYLRQPFPFKTKNSALLVIDMQNFFLDKNSHAYVAPAGEIVPRIRNLVAFYRQRHLPVIFTRHALTGNDKTGIMGRWWRDTIKEDTWDARIIPELVPLRTESVIRKTRYSGFYGTRLAQLFKRLKIKRVVITGVLTHLCCESTARDAFMRDYEVFVVADATASDEKDLYLSALKTLADGFAVIVTTKEVVSR